MANFRSIRPIIPNFTRVKAQDIITAARHAEHITELQLHKTDLKELPGLLPKLPNLRRLDIQNCPLRRLPDSIRHCRNLDTLILNRCSLAALPEALGSCDRLMRLSVENNRMAALPESLAQCLNLRDINLSRNRFSECPALLARLPWLARLYLAHNTITAMPEMGTGYAQLKLLDIRSNRLSILPERAQLPRLEILLLGGNALQEIPNVWGRLPVLEKLDIRRNPIYNLPALPVTMRSLDISGCPLPARPAALFALDQLRELRGPGAEGRSLLRLLAACRQKPVPVAWRAPLFDAFCGNASALATLEPWQCLQSLALPLPALRETLLSFLTTSDPAKAPGAGASVACIGRFSIPLNAIKMRLQKAGLQLVAPVEAGFIAIGRPPYALQERVPDGVVFLREKQLLDVLEPGKAILNKEQIQHLRSLLTHPDEANAALATRILQSAGVPAELLTELLCARMTSSSRSLKKELGLLLERYTPEGSRRVLRLPLLAWAAKNPDTAAARISEALRATVFDGERLYNLLTVKGFL
ncbi:MAG: hypothetical protein KF852_11305 [Saprospiraceae bacterium]|nr:hypothetical protein [Saprospiraceae bacterium]